MEKSADSPDTKLGFRKRLSGLLTGPKPIGFFLFLLILVTTLPALAVAFVLLQRNDAAQREVVETLSEAMAGSIAETIDRELSGMVTTLRVLSTTPSLASGRYKDFYERAKSALAGSGTYLVLLDENFDQILNTRVPYGTPLGPVSDPEPVRRALDARAAVISGVFFEETAERWGFNVILPYVPEGKPPRVLMLTRDAESIANTLSQQMLRGGWNASLVDANGLVIASSFMSTNVGKPFFLDLNAGSPQIARLSNNMAPASFVAITDESAFSGWKVVVWAPTASIERPMRRTLWQLLAGSFIVIALSAGTAWFLGRRIARPVRNLAHDAHRLGAGEMVKAVPYPIAEVATVSAALAEASIDRRAAENDIRLLMREVAHRAKNQLTVVASMAKQTARSARSLPSFLDSFQKRLYGLARSTDLLIAGGASGVDLRELLIAQIEPFRPEDPKRLELSGPSVRLANQAAQTIGLAVHELATNAAKYGAFAARGGYLRVSWQIEEDVLVIVWREHLQRLRRRPVKRGFGTEIIERMLGGTLDAEISRTFHRDGLECVFRIPADRILPERPPPASAAPGA
ncbi:histidine kinase [Chelativorans sp. SCAU2101]|uniref:histidine kinase n=1 Tax=Chelativorans petroleitrophicus TaxID=2975484 RepID=A0A9X2XC16_9HYPH|nr:histidine kinase [Chelativorans petroleitrophicus]